MKRQVCIGLVLLVSVLGLKLGIGNEHAPVSKILIPQTTPTIKTVHAKCPEAKKGCVSCHKRAQTSQWASERLVPPMRECGPCHPEAKDANATSEVTDGCKRCHGALKEGEKPVRGSYPRPNIRFSHKAHQTVASCGRCHPKAANHQTIASGLDVVGMKSCLECHQDSSCRKCHIVRADGRMITNYQDERLVPPDWLKGPSHGSEWTGTHARQAGHDSAYCASCHQDKFCRDCHTGARRPRNIHPGDWLTSHGVSTRLDSPRCKGCHRKQSFCLSCHRRAGVASDSPAKARPQGGRPAYHRGMDTRQLMKRAKRDVVTCVSCHAESSCLNCHMQRINPHPTNFWRKCKALAARNRRACAKCHRTGNPARFCK